MIRVERVRPNEFSVVVEERGSRSEHVVTLDEDYYQRLTGGSVSKEWLIELSFEFLLQREPKESILRRFNLQVINRYFPEYERTVKTR